MVAPPSYYRPPPAYYPPRAPYVPPSRPYVLAPVYAPPVRYPNDAETIAELQRNLNLLGFDAGTVDGALGPGTTEALRAFQRSRRLPSDGIPTPATVAAVRAAVQAQTADAAAGGASRIGAAGQPSFDCSRATTDAEMAICRSPTLADLDVELNQAFTDARASTSPAESQRLAAEQRTWLRERANCGRNVACLQRSMQNRITELRAVAGPGTNSAAAAPTAPVPDQTVAQAPLQALEGPTPPGLRPLPLPLKSSMPLFSQQTSPADAQAFFRLVALGLQPNLIEQKQGGNDLALQYATDWLARPNKYLERPGEWSGRDEFEKGRSRRAFLADDAQTLRDLAPKLPLRVVYAPDVTLPNYDDGLGGFRLNGSVDVSSLQLAPALHPLSGVTWPELFVPAAPAAAKRLLDQIAGPARDLRQNPRSARLLAVITISAPRPGSTDVLLSLDKLSLVDAKLDDTLYAFPVQAGAGATKPDAIAARLLAPPPGVAPIRLRSIDGWPLLTSDETGSHFLALIAAGSVPSLFEPQKNETQALVDNREIALVQQLLEPSAKQALLVFRFGTKWSGLDEFEQARTRQRFEATYLPAIRSFAPKPPLSFAIALNSQLPQYDMARGGFNFGKVDIVQSLPYRSSATGLNWTPQFEPPSLFWPIDPASAERLLRSIAAAADRANRFSTEPSRAVALLAVLDATHIDPRNGNTDLQLKSVSVRSADLRTRLFEFPPIKPELPPFLTAQIPAKLAAPTPVVMDDLVLRLAILRSLRDHTPGWVIGDLWQLKAQADQTFYQHADPADLQPDDARRPFFPRTNFDRSEAALARFKAWARAYADGLPDEVVSPPNQSWRNAANGGELFPVPPGGPLPSLPAALAGSGLQPGQLVQLAGNAPIIAILPNRSEFYSPVLPAQPPLKQPVLATTRYRLGSAEILPDLGRSIATVALHIEPLETVVTAGGQPVLRQTYANVPHLDGSGTTLTGPAATPTNAAMAVSKPPLDAALIDLLTAKSLGGRLSPEAQAYLVLRRWHYEDQRGLSLPGPRFFKLGAPSPSPTEAVAMGPAFARWAAANAPALPLAVLVSGHATVQGSPDRLPWTTMDCLGLSNFADLMGATNAQMGMRSALFDCERKEQMAKAGQTSWTGVDARRCKALALTEAASAAIVGFRDQCGMRDPSLPFPDPLVLRLEIPHVLPAPDLPRALGGKQQVSASATLEIDTVDLSDTPPSTADLLPTDIAELARQGGNSGAQRPGKSGSQFVVFGAKFLSADYRAADGHELGRLGPDRGDSIASLVQAFRANETQPEAADGAFAPDLSSVKLGMSFAAAERVIRANMKVASVLEGKRDSDPADVAPLTSGRLFIAEGGHDMIAIIDEPPAAKGRVLAVWRRLTFPPGVVSLDRLLERLKQKYGPPPGYRPMQIGVPISWYGLAGGDCRTIYQYGPNRVLADFWTGYPATKPVAARLPMLPSPLFAPLAQDSSGWMGCGPFVSATALAAKDAGGNDQLDLSLTDIGLYLKAYRANHPQDGNGARPATPGAPAAPSVAAGIKF